MARLGECPAAEAGAWNTLSGKAILPSVVSLVWFSCSCNLKSGVSHLAALGELRRGLRDALLLELEPGEQFWQESSVVLLRGTLLCTGQANSVPMQQLPGVSVPPICRHAGLA